MGTLKVSGIIELKQFWPQGKEDADTTQLKIKVDSLSFQFSRDDDYDSKHFKKTNVFAQAEILSNGNTASVVKYRNNPTRSYIKVRLQGIDAPELHYKIFDLAVYRNLTTTQKDKLKKVNIEYRQKFGETATLRLKNFLQKYAQDSEIVEIEFYSMNIKKPIDVIDIYGRFVGDLIVRPQHSKKNVNHWIVENGLAFPAFYNSMTQAEIKKMLTLTKKAKKNQAKRIWSQFTHKIQSFDFALTFRKNGVPDETGDLSGKVIFPKVYRRHCAYSILEKAGLSKHKNFTDYLKSKKDDKFIEMKDFLKDKKIEKQFNTIHDHGSLEREPEEIVFLENTKMKMRNIDTKAEITRF